MLDTKPPEQQCRKRGGVPEDRISPGEVIEGGAEALS